MELLTKILAAGSIMGFLDFIWIRFFARNIYSSAMPGMLLEKPNFLAAIAFYAVYLTGVLYFVITPALEKNSWLQALISGMLFGLVGYSTYGLTNLAVFKGFSPQAIAVDILWGMFLTAAVAVGTFFIVKAI